MLRNRKPIGLVLGGGGARGLSHIGVLRVFEDESIPIDLIVGSSMGALVGGAFAAGLDTYALERRLEEFLESPVFQDSALKSIREIQASRELTLPQKIQAFFKNRLFLAQAMFRPGMLQPEEFQAMVDFFLPDIDVRDTQLRFRAVATDLRSAEPVVFSQGSLRKAVMASCAVPGALPPIRDGERLLADGGVIHMVPTTIAREEGARFVVAVSVTGGFKSAEKLSTAVDIYIRSANIGSFHLEKNLLKQADVVILPRVGNLHWTDFELARDLVVEGERAARAELPAIRKGLPVFRRLSRLHRLGHR
ncbi:MAG: patatin-like phospholipase family protein [Acidobacteriota bacterium]